MGKKKKTKKAIKQAAKTGQTLDQLKETLGIKGGLKAALKDQGYKAGQGGVIKRKKQNKKNDEWGFEIPDYTSMFTDYSSFNTTTPTGEVDEQEVPAWFEEWLAASGYEDRNREYQQAVIKPSPEEQARTWQQNPVPPPQYRDPIPPSPAPQFQDLGIRPTPAPIQVPQIGSALPGQVTASQSYRTRKRQAAQGTSQFRI